MTDNTFATQAVARDIELIWQGRIDLTATLRREFPQLTAQGIVRAIDIARDQISEQRKGRSV